MSCPRHELCVYSCPSVLCFQELARTISAQPLDGLCGRCLEVWKDSMTEKCWRGRIKGSSKHLRSHVYQYCESQCPRYHASSNHDTTYRIRLMYLESWIWICVQIVDISNNYQMIVITAVQHQHDFKQYFYYYYYYHYHLFFSLIQRLLLLIEILIASVTSYPGKPVTFGFVPNRRRRKSQHRLRMMNDHAAR